MGRGATAKHRQVGAISSDSHAMRVATSYIEYLYDESGSPIGINYYDGTTLNEYYFVKNIQGDVTAIRDWNGNLIATYIYDAWGNLLSLTDGTGAPITSTTHIGYINPIRYRGYYYDVETGLYYLQSRYYDAKICRFINPDAVISGVGGDILGYNQYAYCFNNPVNFEDESGNWPEWLNPAGVIRTFIKKKVAPKVKKVVNNVKEDYNNFNRNNEDEDKVFDSNYFSAYKGAIVVRTPLDASFSYGIIGLNSNDRDSSELNHEYGHYLQMQDRGVVDYTKEIAIPSITANVLNRMGKLPYDYYGSPWESEADFLGGVNRTEDNTLWPEGSYDSYWDLIRLFGR